MDLLHDPVSSERKAPFLIELELFFISNEIT